MVTRIHWPATLATDSLAFIGTAGLALLLGVLLDTFVRTQPLGLTYRKPLAGLIAADISQTSDSAGATIAYVTFDEVDALLKRPDVIVLDAQDAAFFGLGHLPGARSLSKETFDQDFPALEPLLRVPGKSLLVYCSDADCENSAVVAQKLYDRGFRELYLYKGGMEEWQSAGMPVETSE